MKNSIVPTPSEPCKTCRGKLWKGYDHNLVWSAACPDCAGKATPPEPEGAEPYRCDSKMPGVKCWPCRGSGIYNGGIGPYAGSKPGSCGICRGDGVKRLSTQDAKVANAAYAAGAEAKGREFDDLVATVVEYLDAYQAVANERASAGSTYETRSKARTRHTTAIVARKWQGPPP